MITELTMITKGSLANEYGDYSLHGKEKSSKDGALFFSTFAAAFITLSVVLQCIVLSSTGHTEWAIKFAEYGFAVAFIPIAIAIIFGVRYHRFHHKQLTREEETKARSDEVAHLQKARQELTEIESIKIEGPLNLIEYVAQIRRLGKTKVSRVFEYYKSRTNIDNISLLLIGVIVLTGLILTAQYPLAANVIWGGAGALAAIPFLILLGHAFSNYVRYDGEDSWAKMDQMPAEWLRLQINQTNAQVMDGQSSRQLDSAAIPDLHGV